MSSNANLPAGFFITTIKGKRCTAVPRALTTTKGIPTTSTPVRPTSTTPKPSPSSKPIEPSPQTPESTSEKPPEVLPSSNAAAVAAPVAVITSSQIPIANKPQDTQMPTTSHITEPSPSPSFPAVTSITASTELTTPSSIPEAEPPTETPTESPTETPTGSSTASTSILSAPKELSIAALPNPFTNQNGLHSATETSTSLFPGATNSVVPAQASVLDTTSKSRVAPAPIVGGVMGSLAFVGFVALIFWFFKRRRRYQRDSLLPPFDWERNSFSEGERQSISNEKPMSRFGTKVGYQTDRLKVFTSGIAAGVVGFGALLKSKVRHQRDTPSVDLNRGNSQFFDGPISQHSRNNSVLSSRHSEYTVKDRFNSWWERCIEIVGFNWTTRRNKRLSDPSTMAGGPSGKQSGSNDASDFPHFFHINERDLQLQADGRRGTTSGSSALNFGNLGLNFEPNNPFSDHIPPVASIAQKQSMKKDNPFIDPVAQTQPSAKSKNTYVADVRRSRGQSTSQVKNNQAALRSSSASRPYSRYKSGISLNRDSYRDTFVSTMSANDRRGKGRSDPFDLERPELWISSRANNTANSNGSQDNAGTSNRPNTRGSSILYPDPLRMSSVHGNMVDQVSSHVGHRGISHTHAISNDLSIYSSGLSSLGGWAGPGPDLGPGSNSTSLRGNASLEASSHYRNDSTGDIYTPGDGIIKGSLTEMDLGLAAHRNVNNVSPMSMEREFTTMRETGSTSPVSMVSKYSRRGVGAAL